MKPIPSSDVVEAVEKAKPLKIRYAHYILKSLLFHGYFVPTTLLYLPYVFIRCLLRHGYGRHPNWTIIEAIGVLLTKRTIKLMSFFKMQPIPPRENGWREANNWVGMILSLLNNSGPGGIVAMPPAEISQVKDYVKKGRVDRDWFDPPSIDGFCGILSIKSGYKSNAYGSSLYQGPALVDPSWAKTRIRGLWFMHDGTLHAPRPSTFGGQERDVMLYFRTWEMLTIIDGGAGVTFSAGDPFMGQTLCRTLSSRLKLDIFSVDYNLAPYAPFPVPIVQALAGYMYLINKYGYRPSQIFVGGDSFGAWITMQLEQYLRCDGKHLTNILDGKANTVSGVPGLLLLSVCMLFLTNSPALVVPL